MTTEAIEATGAASARNTVAALRVLRGEPTPEELAALVAVLAARAAGDAGAAEPDRPVTAWTDRSRYVRAGRPEFGAHVGWRASALPR